MLGGASRYDVQSLPFLRAASVFVLAYVVWKMPTERLREVKWPLILLGALAFTMLLQLVKLPPSIWQDFAGRDIVYRIGVAAGMGDVWRPVTFSPASTWNSLASLTVPAAALVLLAWMKRSEWRQALWIFVGIGALSALMGIMQLVLPESDNLYLYAITNAGEAVGLFANRNHNAIFCGVALLAAIDRLQEDWSASELPFRIGGSAVAALLVIGILVNASRAGLLVLVLVFALASLRQLASLRKAKGSLILRLLWLVLPVLGAGLLAVALFTQDRLAGLTRLIEKDPLDEQRTQLFPYFLEMLRDHMPWGAGFGAFEQAYRVIEPAELLGPRYLNQAHNDWIQFFIEGGVAAVVIFVLFALLVARAAISVLRKKTGNDATRRQTLLALMLLALFAVGSLVDYPLRTPLGMIFAVYCLAIAFRPTDAAGEALQVAHSQPKS
ncbi:O-antigen ligase family protein [Erythrobacter alti]|uniref:O-antigen ligase family protein n=1 Tax=Erythrobacter alti TaxID=1896145 RepID=UPI0030F3B3B5